MHAMTLALVGATGGAGTTRTAVELAALGARDGRDVAVIDAAFTTQGLSEYVAGRIDTDCTSLVTDDTGASLSAATYPISIDTDNQTSDDSRADLPGRVDAIPARAPFERLARAKTAEAAQKLEGRIDEASTAYDAVIIDTAPVGSNEAVGAVTAADRVEAVYQASEHGTDALQRLRGRIADIGGSVDGSMRVARNSDTRSASDGNDAEIVLPRTDPAVASAPIAATGSGAYTQAVADAYASAFDTSVGLEFDDAGVIERLRS